MATFALVAYLLLIERYLREGSTEYLKENIELDSQHGSMASLL